MPIDTWGAAEQIRADLDAAGVRATVDPRGVNPPCVLIRRPDLTPVGNTCRNAEAVWDLHLIGKGPDQPNAWRQLDVLLTAVIDVCGPDQVTATTYAVNDTTEYPAYQAVVRTILKG